MNKNSKFIPIVVVLLLLGVGFWYWQQKPIPYGPAPESAPAPGFQEPPKYDTATPSQEQPSGAPISVAMKIFPTSASAGEAATFIWSVNAPQGSISTHSSVHWGTASKAGDFGPEIGPSAAGYTDAIKDFFSGSFELPRDFRGSIIFPSAGAYYWRGHTIVDGKNYWTPEYSTVVK